MLSGPLSDCFSLSWLRIKRLHMKLLKRILYYIKKRLRKCYNASDIRWQLSMAAHIFCFGNLGNEISPLFYTRIWHSNWVWLLSPNSKPMKNPHINWIINPVTRFKYLRIIYGNRIMCLIPNSLISKPCTYIMPIFV